MNLNKTKYIVAELIEKGIISKDKSEAATLIINNEGKYNKEYQTKKVIYSYLVDWSNSLIKEADVEAVYSIIKSKFRDEVELTNEDIKSQVYSYLSKENKYNNFKGQTTNLVESIFPSSNIYVKMFR